MPKDDFIYKAYLVNVMTEGEGVKNLKKLMTSFMNVHQAKKEDQHTVIIKRYSYNVKEVAIYILECLLYD